MEQVVIIGGGIAGLSCLNAFLDNQIPALLLESSKIGQPKMCGEFLAPFAVKLLENWSIGPIQLIKEVNFFAKHRKLELSLSLPAGAFARSTVELQLAARARRLGGRISENKTLQKVIPATHSQPFLLTLNDEEIMAKTVIFASGKLPQQTKINSFPYYGLKLHFPHVVKPETLMMYSIHNAYFGIVPISEQLSNSAFLIKREAVNKAGSCQSFFNAISQSHPPLRTIFQDIDPKTITWLEGKAPEFGFKTVPNWPRAYWIGDAQASIYPAIGYGFAHSVLSALLAVEFYKQNFTNFQATIKKQIKPKLKLGKVMHKLLLNPTYSAPLLIQLQKYPKLADFFLKYIGYTD